MVEESIIKIISEAGIGIGSMIALVVVIIYQLKIMSKFADNIKENSITKIIPEESNFSILQKSDLLISEFISSLKQENQ